MKPATCSVATLGSAFLLFGAGGCSQTADGGPSELLGSSLIQDVVFLTQNVEPEAVMDALFEGDVVLDDVGCLRLDAPDRHTVVWPVGFSLEVDGDDLTVRDAEGRTVGSIGGTFRLGGGEVERLHEGIAMAPSDKTKAEERCPGRYWIVGEAL